MYAMYIKRILDMLFAIGGILVLFPLFILVALAIKADSTGPVFFGHKRNGQYGLPFYALKFRTMVEDASVIGPQFTKSQDPRITRLGKYLRRISVDELPQLLNVLKGEMSIVGPRPPAYKSDLTELEYKILSVKPGLTGLAQVNGRSLLSKEQKRALDLQYASGSSFWLDMSIILKTFAVIVSGKGVN